jgi:hypothetical protein
LARFGHKVEDETGNGVIVELIAKIQPARVANIKAETLIGQLTPQVRHVGLR